MGNEKGDNNSAFLNVETSNIPAGHPPVPTPQWASEITLCLLSPGFASYFVPTSKYSSIALRSRFMFKIAENHRRISM